MPAKRILSVGQCAYDHSGITRTFQKAFQVEVVPADTATEALDLLRKEPFSLVLVNRIFDADGDSGLELIRQVKGDDKLRETPMMLVSNYEDAQSQASAAGAVPGFGKASLGQTHMLDRVSTILQQTPARH